MKGGQEDKDLSSNNDDEIQEASSKINGKFEIRQKNQQGGEDIPKPNKVANRIPTATLTNKDKTSNQHGKDDDESPPEMMPYERIPPKNTKANTKLCLKETKMINFCHLTLMAKTRFRQLKQ